MKANIFFKRIFKRFEWFAFLLVVFFLNKNISAQIKIDKDFPGGNVVVEKISNDTVYFTPDLTGNEKEWFYWYFRAISVESKTYYFKSTQANVFTNLGPCISEDGGDHWEWFKKSPPFEADGFTYHFTGSDKAVRFSNGMPYTYDDFRRFFKPYKNDSLIKIDTLCITRNNRSVEKILISNFKVVPKYKVLITARHHASEMMSSYIVEGIIETMLSRSFIMNNFLSETEIMIIPFVDKDGVEDGDQGKWRSPHDHNRDYSGESIYASTRQLRQEIPVWSGSEKKLRIVFDIHNPWIKGRRSERIYFVGKEDEDIEKEQIKFADILYKTKRGDLCLEPETCFLRFGEGWNNKNNYQGKLSCSGWGVLLKPYGVTLSTSIEFPFALNNGEVITIEKARRFGNDLAYALAYYLNVSEK
ncbi:MAG: hypothetical protein K8R74_02095 [Bacteroidales bacterium]|nr:hypothetical protein [Bacteroidales bacterium]